MQRSDGWKFSTTFLGRQTMCLQRMEERMVLRSRVEYYIAFKKEVGLVSPGKVSKMYYHSF